VRFIKEPSFLLAQSISVADLAPRRFADERQRAAEQTALHESGSGMLALHVIAAAALSPLLSHEYFLREVALSQPPVALGPLAEHLIRAGGSLIEPQPVGLARHPLIVPLTEDADGCITGLLRWPNGQKELPVVRTSTGSRQLTWLAESADK